MLWLPARNATEARLCLAVCSCSSWLCQSPRTAEYCRHCTQSEAPQVASISCPMPLSLLYSVALLSTLCLIEQKVENQNQSDQCNQVKALAFTWCNLCSIDFFHTTCLESWSRNPSVSPCTYLLCPLHCQNGSISPILQRMIELDCAFRFMAVRIHCWENMWRLHSSRSWPNRWSKCFPSSMPLESCPLVGQRIIAGELWQMSTGRLDLCTAMLVD